MRILILLLAAFGAYGQISPPPTNAPSGAAGGNLSGTYPNPVVAKINGTTVATNATANQVPLTTAAAVTVWTGIPSCLDSAGQHLNFNTTTHAFSCGTSGSATPPASPANSVQFNNAGAFGGNATFLFDPTGATSFLSLGGPESGIPAEIQYGPAVMKIISNGGVTPTLTVEDNTGNAAAFATDGAGPFGVQSTAYATNAGGAATAYYATAAADGAAIQNAWAYYVGGAGTFSSINGGSINTAVGFYSQDLQNPGSIPNRYYSWFDSQGVRRVKEDSTFDSVGQAIDALYNPQVTKYTAGAADFERVVLGQWNGNVAEIGTEKGGTGTLRPLRLIGQEVQIPVTTFATLATCAAGTEGTMKPVSDSSTATWGATITGGGANHVIAYCNGTNWTVSAK